MNLNFTKKNLLISVVALAVIGAAIFFLARKGPKNVSLDLGGEKTSENQSIQDNPADADTNYGQENIATEEIVDENGETIIVNDQDLDAEKIYTGDENVMAHITTNHCDSGCKAFGDKAEFFEYCKQVCGISPIKNVSDCDGKKDIEKDYCLKDLAVGKKDSSLCNEISDANVKKTCKSRILEEILENM